MPTQEGEFPEASFRQRHVAHYHGDTVRALFVVGAVVMLVAETTGASLPLTMLGIVSFAVALVIFAGITNPAQKWIHFLNALTSIYGAMTFGLFAIQEYRTHHDFFNITYLYVEALAFIFLIAVYYTTKTVRGILLRPHFL
jgi:hypothetical protein